MGTSLFKEEANRYAFLNYSQGYGWIRGREIMEDGKYGSLVPVEDPQSLAEAMLSALTNPVDPDILTMASRDFFRKRSQKNT